MKDNQAPKEQFERIDLTEQAIRIISDCMKRFVEYYGASSTISPVSGFGFVKFFVYVLKKFGGV